MAEAEEAFRQIIRMCHEKKVGVYDIAKREAEANLESTIDARELFGRVSYMLAAGLGRTPVEDALKDVDQLLAHCPHMRSAQAFKARCLCQLHRWREAKIFAETVVLTAHPTIRKLYSHPDDKYPVPDMKDLAWTWEQERGEVKVDRSAVVGAMLCMGPLMAREYLNALKNVETCRLGATGTLDFLRRILARFVLISHKFFILLC